jgi:hypothetical protein
MVLKKSLILFYRSEEENLRNLCNEQHRRLVSCILKNDGSVNIFFNDCWRKNYDPMTFKITDAEKLARKCLAENPRE